VASSILTSTITCSFYVFHTNDDTNKKHWLNPWGRSVSTFSPIFFFQILKTRLSKPLVKFISKLFFKESPSSNFRWNSDFHYFCRQGRSFQNRQGFIFCVTQFLFQVCLGWGAILGSFNFHLYSHHSTAEPQLLPSRFLKHLLKTMLNLLRRDD
jgi:hypothetical protein